MAGAEETADGGPAGAAKGCDPPPAYTPFHPFSAARRRSQSCVRNENESKRAVLNCVCDVRFPLSLPGPVPAPAFGGLRPHSPRSFSFPLLARLLRGVCERGGRERVRGSRRSRGRSVEPRPRAPPRTATVPHGGGRTRRDPCAGCALADAPPSRGPKPHGGATRCAAACDGDLLPSSRRGGGKGEIPFLPPPPLQAREGRPIARASRGRKRASDRLESTCWRGLASLLATSLDGRNASPSSPQPDPGELTERDGATGVSLSSAHPGAIRGCTDDSETLPDSTLDSPLYP
jgi:hypothetical protein